MACTYTYYEQPPVLKPFTYLKANITSTYSKTTSFYETFERSKSINCGYFVSEILIGPETAQSVGGTILAYSFDVLTYFSVNEGRGSATESDVLELDWDINYRTGYTSQSASGYQGGGGAVSSYFYRRYSSSIIKTKYDDGSTLALTADDFDVGGTTATFYSLDLSEPAAGGGFCETYESDTATVSTLFSTEYLNIYKSPTPSIFKTICERVDKEFPKLKTGVYNLESTTNILTTREGNTVCCENFVLTCTEIQRINQPYYIEELRNITVSNFPQTSIRDNGTPNVVSAGFSIQLDDVDVLFSMTNENGTTPLRMSEMIGTVEDKQIPRGPQPQGQGAFSRVKVCTDGEAAGGGTTPAPNGKRYEYVYEKQTRTSFQTTNDTNDTNADSFFTTYTTEQNGTADLIQVTFKRAFITYCSNEIEGYTMSALKGRVPSQPPSNVFGKYPKHTDLPPLDDDEPETCYMSASHSGLLGFGFPDQELTANETANDLKLYSTISIKQTIGGAFNSQQKLNSSDLSVFSQLRMNFTEDIDVVITRNIENLKSKGTYRWISEGECSDVNVSFATKTTLCATYSSTTGATSSPEKTYTYASYVMEADSSLNNYTDTRYKPVLNSVRISYSFDNRYEGLGYYENNDDLYRTSFYQIAIENTSKNTTILLEPAFYSVSIYGSNGQSVSNTTSYSKQASTILDSANFYVIAKEDRYYGSSQNTIPMGGIWGSAHKIYSSALFNQVVTGVDSVGNRYPVNCEGGQGTT